MIPNTPRTHRPAKSRWRAAIALLLAFTLIAAACGDDDDDTAAEAPPTSESTDSVDGGLDETPADASDDAMSEDEMAEDAMAADDDSDDAMSEDDTLEEEMVDDDMSPEDMGTFPVGIDIFGTEVVVESRPERIVSLSPSSTEMLFAMGAGPQVIAVDSFSYYPEEAPVTDLSGFEPNVEAIIAFDPDLVIVSFDPGDLGAALGEVGIPMLTMSTASTIGESYSQMEKLGAATGNVGGAAELVLQIQTDIEELAAMVPERTEPLTYYHELDDTLYSVTSSTFVGEVYAIAGLVNAADPADPDGESFGYPQLSAEFLVDADPDLIFLADTKCCSQDASTVAARPGWDGLTAVQNGNIIELDDDIASRWGPRIVDFLRVIVEATSNVEQPA